MQRWLPPFEWLPPRRLSLLEKEPTVPDPTPPRPAPAHPWKKTARTVLAGIAVAAVVVPIVVDELDVDPSSKAYAFLAGAIALLGLVTRILALPVVDRLLGHIGLGHDDVEASQVLALVAPEENGPRIVAGERAALPTGTSLPSSTTVAQLVPPDALGR